MVAIDIGRVCVPAIVRIAEGAGGRDDDRPVLELARDVVAIGPGLGQGRATQRFVTSLVDRATMPLVIDADGLNAFTEHPDRLTGREGRDVIITPHPGEMARLLGMTTQEVQASRMDIARNFAVGASAGVFLVIVATALAWAPTVFGADAWRLVLPLGVGLSGYVVVAVFAGVLAGPGGWKDGGPLAPNGAGFAGLGIVSHKGDRAYEAFLDELDKWGRRHQRLEATGDREQNRALLGPKVEAWLKACVRPPAPPRIHVRWGTEPVCSPLRCGYRLELTDLRW